MTEHTRPYGPVSARSVSEHNFIVTAVTLNM